MRKIIKIEGMTCGHCESSVKNALSKLENLEVIEVSKDKKLACVEVSGVDNSVLTETIDNIGFDVVEIINE